MWQELVDAGLDPKEAKLYLAVVEAQRSTVAEAADLAGITRTNAYDIVKRLAARGLVSLSETGPTGRPAGRGRAVLTANDPGQLLEEWAQRKDLLDDLVPRLRALRGDGARQPRVRFMEGDGGIRGALFETLAWPSPLLGILAMKDLLVAPGQAAMREYIDERKRRDIWFRVVRSPERDYPRGWPSNAQDLREARFAPSSYVFAMSLIIGPDAVAIISSQREKYGMMIESTEYAQMQASMFEVLWQASSVGKPSA